MTRRFSRLGIVVLLVAIPALQGCRTAADIAMNVAFGPIVPIRPPAHDIPDTGAPSDHRLASADDAYVCRLALRDGAWETQEQYRPWVGEAEKRQITVKDCQRIRIADAFDGQVCRNAAAENAAALPDAEAEMWREEAEQRGLTPETCPPA